MARHRRVSFHIVTYSSCNDHLLHICMVRTILRKLHINSPHVTYANSCRQTTKHIKIVMCYICVQLYAYLAHMFRMRTTLRIHYTSVTYSYMRHIHSHRAHLILLLLNTTCPVLANSVDPDQLASEEAN